jgi:hypothetical protein
MMPLAPPAVAPPPVLRQNWKTLAQIASRWSKTPNVDACPHTIFIYPSVLRNKPTNLLQIDFEAQTKKLSWSRHRMSTRVLTPSSSVHRFWGTNRQTSSKLILRPKPINCRGDFEAQITKPPQLPVLRPKLGNLNEWFWCKTTRTVAIGSETKPGETIDLGFEAKPKNSCSSSPCSWYRPHTVSPDLFIVRSLSTRPVLDHS